MREGGDLRRRAGYPISIRTRHAIFRPPRPHRMKRILFATAAALAAASYACAPPRPSEQDYLSVISRVMNVAVQDGQTHVAGEKAEGPLIVDVKSFAVGGRLVTLHPVDRQKVKAALPGNYVTATPDSALFCDTSSLGSGCWVKSYGIFVHLKLMASNSPDRMQAHVSVTTTDRRAYPTNYCERIWKVDFARAPQGWNETGHELIKDCD